MVFGLPTRSRPATEWRELAVGGKACAVRIQRRRNARRLTLRVRDDKAVCVTAPPGAADADIEDFVAEHRGWIGDRLRRIDEAAAGAVPGFDGPAILLAGEPKRVELARDPLHRGRGRVEEAPERLLVRINAGSRVRPSTVLEGWLRGRARDAIEAELRRVLPLLGEAPCPVGIRDQRTRWGSCSASRRLSFNWRLAMAPPECLRYVVVHEAAHLVHPDHSPRFWGLVAELMPDYRRHQQWLRAHQTELFAGIGDRLAGLGEGEAPGPAA